MILYILLSVIIVSLLSFVGIFLISIKEKLLKKIIFVLIAFAVGAMFGDVFLHIIPHLYGEHNHGEQTEVSIKNISNEHGILIDEGLEEENEHSHLELHEVHESETIPKGAFILLGILLFFGLEKFIRWRHCHHLPDENHKHPVGIMNLVGDGMHNFLDGVMIASSYIISPIIGFSTTLAVIFHEIPQEIGDYATLLHAGYSRKKALIFNFFSSVTAIIGAILVILLGAEFLKIDNILLPIIAGNFIYIAGSDLIPLLHEKNSTYLSIIQIFAIFLGFLVMYFLTFSH